MTPHQQRLVRSLSILRRLQVGAADRQALIDHVQTECGPLAYEADSERAIESLLARDIKFLRENLSVNIPNVDRSNNTWYIVERTTGRRKKIGTSNRPQIGRIKMLGIGNQARCYLLYTGESPRLPSYIRLGKWNSKAKVSFQPVTFQTVQLDRATGTPLLNPVDLAEATKLQTFDMIGIHPVPLIRNAIISGLFYRLADQEQTLLPANMRFGVEETYRGR